MWNRKGLTSTYCAVLSAQWTHDPEKWTAWGKEGEAIQFWPGIKPLGPLCVATKCGDEARAYTSECWRVVLVLKADLVRSVLRGSTPTLRSTANAGVSHVVLAQVG